MKEERMRILNMVAEGKVTAEEGARLIEALGEGGKEPLEESKTGAKKPRLLVIKVHDEKDNTKVHVALPLALADLALKFIPQTTLHTLGQQHGVDIVEILRGVQQDLPEGKLVDVTSDTAKVEISIE